MEAVRSMTDNISKMRHFYDEENVQGQIKSEIWLLRKHYGLIGDEKEIAEGLRRLLTSCGFDQLRNEHPGGWRLKPLCRDCMIAGEYMPLDIEEKKQDE